MTIHEALFVAPDSNGNGTSATDARLALAALFVPSADGVRPGVLYRPGASNLITGSSSGMAYDVAGFEAVLVKLDSVGPYLLANRGTQSVPTSVAPATGSRYDVIYVRQPDVEQGDSTSVADINVVVGTSGSSPVIPAAPAGAMVLGTALIPANAANTNAAGVTISSTVQFTALRGTPVAVRNATEQAGVHAYDGAQVMRLDANDAILRWTVTNGWVPAATFSSLTPHAVARRGTEATLTTTTATVAMSSVDFARGGLVASGGTFTVPNTGWYELDAQLIFSTPTADPGETTLHVRWQNLSTNSLIAGTIVPAIQATQTAQVRRVVQLNAGTQIGVQASQTSGVFRTVGANTDYNVASVRLVGLV